MSSPYVSFDWAMKRLLRDKANHEVIEGLLFALTKSHFTIVEVLESEGNQETESDKFNRVDMLAKNETGELIIVEVQNSHDLDYFQRMAYGTSKVITEYMQKGDDYGQVKKVYSVNIVYFSLGQGDDYAYHGKTTFYGLHEPHDVLMLSERQREQFFRMDPEGTQREAGDLFPEYFVLRVNKFNELAKTPLEEWMKFLKDGQIDSDTTTPGLQRARDVLRIDSLTEEEQKRYRRHWENISAQKSVLRSCRIEGIKEGVKIGIEKGEKIGIEKGEKIGIKKGEKKRETEIAISMKADGLPTATIAKHTGLSPEEIENL